MNSPSRYRVTLVLTILIHLLQELPVSTFSSSSNRPRMVMRWTVLMLAMVGAQALEQKFAMEPEDQTAVVGSRVILPCRILHRAGLVQWTKGGWGLGNLTGYSTYTMVGNKEEDDFSLQIYPVKMEDDDIYQCQVGSGPVNGELPLRSRTANLTVLIPPEAPKIIQGSYLVTTEDREIELECISVGGKPPAEITWIDGRGNLLTNKIDYVVEPVLNLKTYTARSILKFSPMTEHHNTTFTCQAQNPADRVYKSAHLRLEVKYAPKVIINVVNNNSRVIEGQNIHLSCSAHANPPHITYRWFINDTIVLGDPTTELTLKNISQKHDNAVVRCEVSNIVGKSADTEILNISYGPKFRIKPYSVQADVGASVTLTCDVDGNPSPNIVWIHEDSGRVVSTSSNLTLTVTKKTAGRYFCRATVPGFPDIRAEATVYMKGKPTIISHRTQYGVPGDDVRLECSAFSIPTPQKVIWSFKGENVGRDIHYTVLEDQLAEGIKSTLIIQDASSEHFGVYNCTVSNPYGSDIAEIILKAQKSFPVHSTIFGIVGGVAVILILILMFLLCQTKTKKTQVKKTEEAKVRKSSDKSSEISNLKLDIEYSECNASDTCSEKSIARVGLPLAGPVPLDHRYSQCYSVCDIPEPAIPLDRDGQSNNGYVPIVDYCRDYKPPTTRVSPTRESGSVDPRYSAVYGNPYLRLSANPHLPPPPGPTYQTPSQRGTLATHV